MNWNEVTGRWRLLAARADAAIGTTPDDGSPSGLATGRTLLKNVRTRYGAIKSDAGRRIDRWMTPSSSTEAANEPKEQKVEEIS